MSKNLTLTEAVKRIEENGEKIQIGNYFDSFESFALYFEHHYKPILEKLDEEWSREIGAKRFIASDLLALFE